VHWPKGIAAKNELRTTPVHFIDIVPTVLEVAGGEMPREWNGTPLPPAPGLSVVPLFAKDGSVKHELLWWLHEGNRAIRVGDWKLVAAKDEPWELYDLTTDRIEQHNLAEQYPDKVRELSQRWEAELDAMKPLAKSAKE
jgi:arylsulfatase